MGNSESTTANFNSVIGILKENLQQTAGNKFDAQLQELIDNRQTDIVPDRLSDICVIFSCVGTITLTVLVVLLQRQVRILERRSERDDVEMRQRYENENFRTLVRKSER